MKAPQLPAADEKCGAKIDYVAKRLALALAALGFKRKGRQLVAAGGEGDGAHWKIVQLQGDKWNEGPRGAFFVNLAVQFPALMRLQAQRPGMDWLTAHFDQIDEALGQLRQRLGPLQAALPPTHACARPLHSDEYKFSRDTDLAALADAVVQAQLEVGLPWLERHASLQALAHLEGSLLTADVDVRVAAAVLLGERARAQQILLDERAHFEQGNAVWFASVRQWYACMGLDVSVLPGQPAAPRTSEWQHQREASLRAEEAAHEQRAQAIRAEARVAQNASRAQSSEKARPTPATPNATEAPDLPLSAHALAEAWVAEQRARWRQRPKPMADLPSGRDVAALDAAGRESVLLAMLQMLVATETAAGPRKWFNGEGDTFDLDRAVQPLLEALLPTLDTTTEATALATLQAMTVLVTRWRHELVTGSYPWGFAALVQWLAGPACAPHRAALQPAIAAWLAAYSQFAVASFERLRADVAAEQAKAADPSHPLHEVLKEAREREAELGATRPPPSHEETCRRIGEYPEQQMAADDKHAVATLRRELKRDATSGRLPLAWDGDDWGEPAQRAWQAQPAQLREALEPTLQGWLEGVDTRPTKQWLRALAARTGALPPALSATWRPWMIEQLAAFESCSGRIEWATTGARPGVGARLGERSENLLLGLMWWAWQDVALDAATLEPALQRVANGAWQRVPEVGARAPAVGGLALRMLAGLGEAVRERVAAVVHERGAAKQLKQAAQRAVKEPLAR